MGMGGGAGIEGDDLWSQVQRFSSKVEDGIEAYTQVSPRLVGLESGGRILAKDCWREGRSGADKIHCDSLRRGGLDLE